MLLRYVLFLYGLGLMAQIDMPPSLVTHRNYWDEDRLITLKSNREIIITDQHGNEKTLSLPPAALFAYYHNGFHYITRYNSTTKTSTIERRVDGKWEIELTYKSEKNKIFRFIPLSKHRYLIQLFLPERTKRGVGYFFVAKKESSDATATEQPIEDNILNGFYTKDASNSPELNPQYSLSLQIPTSYIMIPHGDHISIVIPSIGYILTLDSNSGKTKRATWLYEPGSPEQTNYYRDLAFCIIGIQPLRDGNVLIAARSKEAFFKSRRYADQPNSKITIENIINKSVKPKDAIEYETNRLQFGQLAYPHINYVEYSATDGKIWQTATPHNGPSVIESIRQIQKFRLQINHHNEASIAIVQ